MHKSNTNEKRKKIENLWGGVLLVASFLCLSLAGCKPNSFQIEYLAGEGGYIVGDTVQTLKKEEAGANVTAKAQEGYLFSSWSDGVTTPERTDFGISEDMTLTANFVKIESFKICYVAGEGGFIVGDRTQSVRIGESTSTVEAIPKAGYNFSSWSDGKTDAIRQEENVAADVTLTANFSKIEYWNVSYAAGEGGCIVGDREQTVVKGEDASEVEAVPKTSYVFSSWSDGETSAVRRDTAISSDISLTAQFKKIYELNIISADEVRGKVSGGGKLICFEDESVEVEAVPALGYKFSKWSDGVMEAKRTLSPTQDIFLVASFEMEVLSLPVFEINTKDGAPILDKENYISCAVTLSHAGKSYEFSEKTGKIKGRGNTTWEMPKKPYKLKFDEKVDVFGFGAAKTWVLLADYGDKSLLRNRIAFGLGDALELEFNNVSMPVDLYLNREYRGEYLFCKQTEAGSTRVNIDEEPNSKDPAFLLELDFRAYDEGMEGLDWFFLNETSYVVKSPETDEEGYTADVTAAIRDKLQECWTVLESGDFTKVQKLIDVESFAKTYIVNELTHPVDIGVSSWYLYRQTGGKLKSGPLWDYDVSMGNISYADEANNPQTLYVSVNIWYQKLLEYSEFKALVGKILKRSEGKIQAKISSIVAEAMQDRDSYLRNFTLWTILGKDTWPNPPEVATLKTWEEQVEFVVDYLQKSLSFLLETYS